MLLGPANYSEQWMGEKHLPPIKPYPLWNFTAEIKASKGFYAGQTGWMPRIKYHSDIRFLNSNMASEAEN